MSDKPICLDYGSKVASKFDWVAVVVFLLGLISIAAGVATTVIVAFIIFDDFKSNSPRNPVPLFILPYLPGLAAIILAIISLVRISHSHGRCRGRGFAITAIILGILGGPIGVALVVSLFLIFVRTGSP
jgi:hypothetical protein